MTGAGGVAGPAGGGAPQPADCAALGGEEQRGGDWLAAGRAMTMEQAIAYASEEASHGSDAEPALGEP